MSELNHAEDPSAERLNQMGGPNESREDMTAQERDLRAKRDLALNTFRQGKLFGSFNSQYRHMRDLCGDSDTAYDSTLSANEDYLRRLRKARTEGTQLKDVKEPTLAMGDSKIGQFLKKAAKRTDYLFAKALSWTSPVLMISDIAGELWDKEEFEDVRNKTELTEKQRERVMIDLNNEIDAAARQLQNKGDAAADKKAELKAKKKDEQLAIQIREGLGIQPAADNDNDLDIAA